MKNLKSGKWTRSFTLFYTQALKEFGGGKPLVVSVQHSHVCTLLKVTIQYPTQKCFRANWWSRAWTTNLPTGRWSAPSSELQLQRAFWIFTKHFMRCTDYSCRFYLRYSVSKTRMLFHSIITFISHIYHIPHMKLKHNTIFFFTYLSFWNYMKTPENISELFLEVQEFCKSSVDRGVWLESAIPLNNLQICIRRL